MTENITHKLSAFLVELGISEVAFQKAMPKDARIDTSVLPWCVQDIHESLPNFSLDFEQYANRIYNMQRGREPLWRAFTSEKHPIQTIFDATAGLGRDGLLLASRGFHVQLNEREPIIALLLIQQLALLPQSEKIHGAKEISERLKVSAYDIEKPLESELSFDAVYLDPMFPARQKSALVKANMRWLQKLARLSDEAKLLKSAKKIATERIVVKRPKSAAYLASKVPHASITSKSHRYDIYLPNSL